MNVKRLEGARLDYWVAKSAGLKLMTEAPDAGSPHDPESGSWHPDTFHPATNWSHAGPIVANEWFVIEDILNEWFGPQWPDANMIINFPVAWFMRAYVASQFGDEVEDIVAEQGPWAFKSGDPERIDLKNL